MIKNLRAWPEPQADQAVTPLMVEFIHPTGCWLGFGRFSPLLAPRTTVEGQKIPEVSGAGKGEGACVQMRVTLHWGTFQTPPANTGKTAARQQFSLPRISTACLNRPFAERLKRSSRRSTPAAFQKGTGIRLRLDWQLDGQAAASPADQLVLIRILAGYLSFHLHIDQSAKRNWAIGKFLSI